MSSIIKNNRLTLYLSPRRDKDLRKNIDNAGLTEHGDLCDYIKELLRDGIKYREGGYITNVATHSASNYELDMNHKVATSNSDALIGMPIERVSLSDQETEEMFDKL